MILVRKPANLLGGEGVGFARFGDHLAHFTDAFGALRFALIALENIARAGGPGLNGARHVALSQAITVTHVQSRLPRSVSCDWFSIAGIPAIATRSQGGSTGGVVDDRLRASHLRPMSAPACQLYLITPPVIDDLEAFAARLEAALDAGPVAALQIRLKPASDSAITATVRRLAPIARSRDVAVILNDRPDLASALGCDGVHVGQEDASVASARRIMGKSAMIGATCHDSRHLGMEAAEQGADYVAFGAFYPTATKETLHRPELEILTVWQETMEIRAVV